PPTELYTLSLHDALPISASISRAQVGLVTLISVRRSPIISRPTKIKPFSFSVGATARAMAQSLSLRGRASPRPPAARLPRVSPRSEEHTSELQSRENLVC